MDRIAAIALGSNLGDRRANLAYAVGRLESVLTGVRVSSCYETTPVGVSDPQPQFLNAALVGRTAESPQFLLKLLLDIERERGRERPYPAAPRTLDLDLILLGDAIIDAPGLVVPHPRFRERPFVLEPLAEIAPDLRDPVTGRTITELFRSAIEPGNPGT